MQNKQRMITAGVTIAAAAVTAHLMQSGGGDSAQRAVNGANVAAAVAAPTPRAPEVEVPVRTSNEVVVLAPNPAPEAMPATAPADDVVLELADDAMPTPPSEMPMPAAFPETVAEGSEPSIEAPNPVPAMPVEIAIADVMPDAADAATMIKSLIDAVKLPTDMDLPELANMPKRDIPDGAGALAVEIAAVMPEGAESVEDAPIQHSEFGLPCGPILSASSQQSAMVAVTLTAPCRAEQMITVLHEGMEFTTRLDNLGIYSGKVPAMAENALFKIRFEDGEDVSAEIDVNDANLERIALVKSAGAGLQIHALEFGADYDGEGHIWSGAPGDALAFGIKDGGFMTLLGDAELPDAKLVEVYTFPFDSGANGNSINLSIEAEVTADNCGTEAMGRSIMKAADGKIESQEMTVAVPDCSAIGEYLVLKNMVRDLTIASN